MHPRIAELIDYLEQQRATLLQALSLIPEPLRDRRCDPATWSAAEVLEHLHRVEKGIVRLLIHSVERAKIDGVELERDASSVLASLDPLRLLDRSLRVIAPEPVTPRGQLTAAQAVAALRDSRQALVSALHEADGLALGRITRTHPTLGTLDLYQWVLFVGQHEARHAGQLQDLARQL
ncbi:MAG: DinB family protein, partial [Gemmatimonadales bacterium]